MKVKFTESPTGTFGLAYFAGDVAEVSDEQAKLLIEAKMAVPETGKSKTEKAKEEKPTSEKAKEEKPTSEKAKEEKPTSEKK